MKRYLLFVGPNFYPSGGWSDFAGSFDELGQAKAHLRRGDVRRAGSPETIIRFDQSEMWFQIVDRHTGAMYDREGWHDAPSLL